MLSAISWDIQLLVLIWHRYSYLVHPFIYHPLCIHLCSIGGISFRNSHFGAGNAFSWTEGIECNGNESTLLECPHKTIGVIDPPCDESNHVGVMCLICME